VLGVVAPLAVWGIGPPPPVSRALCQGSPHNQTLYDFQAWNLWGNETIEFSRYQGKVVLAYNVASG